MNLDNFVHLSGASLLNTPSISSFGEIVFDASRVQRGDLFVAFETGKIQEALSNGAYGVLVEDEVTISDNEVAWLEVASIQGSLERLLRHKLIQHGTKAVFCLDVHLKLCSNIALPPEVYLFSSSEFIKNFKALYRDTPVKYIFAPYSLEDSSLFTSRITLPKVLKSSISIIEQTIFETSFIYKDIYYERELLSPFFLPYLEELLSFLDSVSLEYRLKKFTHIDHFEPIFVDRSFNIKKFGLSSKVLIFESDVELISDQIPFLEHYAPWARTIYLLPYSQESVSHSKVYLYKDATHLLSLLRDLSYDMALVAGFDKSILDNMRDDKTRGQLSFTL